MYSESHLIICLDILCWVFVCIAQWKDGLISKGVAKIYLQMGGGHRLVIAPSHHSHSLKKSQLRLIHTSFFLERWEKMTGLKNQRKKTLNKSVTPPPQKKKKRYLPKSAWSPIFCFKTRQCSPNNDCFYKIGLGVVGNTFFAEQSRGGGGANNILY